MEKFHAEQTRLIALLTDFSWHNWYIGVMKGVLLSIDPGEDPEDLLDATREARSRLALSRVRAAARRAGSDGMTDKQVGALTSKVRAERKAKP